MKASACWLLLAPVLLTTLGLVQGADWLLRPTPGWNTLPLGNAAVWLSLVCLATLLVWQGRRRALPAWLRWLPPAGLCLALAWAPIGYLASGNWRFSFSGSEHGLQSWLLFSGVVVAALLAGLVAALLSRPDAGVRHST